MFAHLNDEDDLVLKHTQRNRKQIIESDNNTQKQVKKSQTNKMQQEAEAEL